MSNMKKKTAVEIIFLASCPWCDLAQSCCKNNDPECTILCILTHAAAALVAFCHEIPLFTLRRAFSVDVTSTWLRACHAPLLLLRWNQGLWQFEAIIVMTIWHTLPAGDACTYPACIAYMHDATFWACGISQVCKTAIRSPFMRRDKLCTDAVN